MGNHILNIFSIFKIEYTHILTRYDCAHPTKILNFRLGGAISGQLLGSMSLSKMIDNISVLIME